MHQVGINTKSKVEFQEITATVSEAVRTSGVQNGVCYLFVPHTTAGITVNEHADPSVVDDIETQLEAMVPQQRSYRHMEGNAPAHIKASIIGSSLALPVNGGKLVLGTWQGVFFCEFDGPRHRNLLIKIIPDKP